MKKGTISLSMGLLLMVAAFILTGYNLWDNYRAGIEAQNILNRLITEIDSNPIPETGRMSYRRGATLAEDEVEYPDYVLNPNMDMLVKQIDGIDCIGVISIPAIERELPVCSEWNYENLKTAPCRYVGSAYLNNLVICAHNYDIHFGSIKSLSYGDRVSFTDTDGNVFNYKVIEIETLQPTAIDEMTGGNGDLTLFTCTIGGATRVTVRCERE